MDNNEYINKTRQLEMKLTAVTEMFSTKVGKTLSILPVSVFGTVREDRKSAELLSDNLMLVSIEAYDGFCRLCDMLSALEKLCDGIEEEKHCDNIYRARGLLSSAADEITGGFAAEIKTVLPDFSGKEKYVNINVSGLKRAHEALKIRLRDVTVKFSEVLNG